MRGASRITNIDVALYIMLDAWFAEENDLYLKLEQAHALKIETEQREYDRK